MAEPTPKKPFETAAVVQTKELRKEWMWLREVAMSLCRFVAILGGYLCVAILFYAHEEEDWTAVDAIYFGMMTCSTVGYGDISPSEGFVNRGFTCGMIFVGIVAVFPVAGGALSPLFNPITLAGRQALERLFPQETVDLDGDGVADYRIPRHPLIYYSKCILPSLLLNLVVQLASAGVFCALEEWDFGSAFYHCIVTGTTVGYGDVTIVTQSGRMWASVHMLIAVAMIAELISTIGSAVDERRMLLGRVAQLERQLDDDLVNKVMASARDLRPAVDHSQGLTELEYALAMLITLGVVDVARVRPFLKAFRRLDVNNDGLLNGDDLRIMSALSPAQLGALQRANSKRRLHRDKTREVCQVVPSMPPSGQDAWAGEPT